MAAAPARGQGDDNGEPRLIVAVVVIEDAQQERHTRPAGRITPIARAREFGPN